MFLLRCRNKYPHFLKQMTESWGIWTTSIPITTALIGFSNTPRSVRASPPLPPTPAIRVSADATAVVWWGVCRVLGNASTVSSGASTIPSPKLTASRMHMTPLMYASLFSTFLISPTPIVLKSPQNFHVPTSLVVTYLSGVDVWNGLLSRCMFTFISLALFATIFNVNFSASPVAPLSSVSLAKGFVTPPLISRFGARLLPCSPLCDYYHIQHQ